MPVSLFNARAISALVLATTVTTLAVQGDVIILKDGYTLYGVKTIKEKSMLMDDHTKEAFWTAMPNGMTALDDGPRWVVFPNSSRQVADASDTNKFKDFASYTRDRYRGENKLLSSAINPKPSPWDLKEWTRVVEFQDLNPRLKHTVKQHINVITPHYLRMGSSSHNMAQYFLTREFSSEAIRSMLVNHPSLIEMPGKPEADKRERLVRFWIQANWLDEADKELATLLTALPAEKERHTRLKSEVNGLRADALLVEIERARDSGRHNFAVKNIAAFPKDDVPRAVAVKLTGLQADYELRTSRFALATRFLEELPKLVVNPDSRFLVEGAAAVRREIHMDTLSRLEVFVTLADRAEKDTKAGRRPAHIPEELIAAAITGWHLGKVAAEPKVGSAYKCWMTRQMALDYLRNTQKAGRIKDLETYLASSSAMAYDELEKLVAMLPPPEAPTVIPAGTVTLKMPPSATFGNGMTYVLRLPDEYQPGRSYPLLIALPDPALDSLDDKAAEKMLALFGDLPNRLGYIIASPIWWSPLNSTYQYSTDEHSEVLNLMRHLRRAFQIDSDRIFLWGNGEGASMALDMGGAHPDLFAGVIPVNPSVYQPLYIPAQYWVNFHQLPVYLVMGDKFGPSVSAIRMLSERWMTRGFPALIVSYKGRGAEFFPEELPFAFDWMGRKRRADPGKQVGPPAFGDLTSAGFSCVRATDNRFHWLSSDSLHSNRFMTPVVGRPATVPAKFSARIVAGNAVEAKAIGMKELTVWFGRGMLDYSKPVRLKVNDNKPITEKITPQIPVLMEDLYDRGDRQRPYFYRAELRVSQQ